MPVDSGEIRGILRATRAILRSSYSTSHLGRGVYALNIIIRKRCPPHVPTPFVNIADNLRRAIRLIIDAIHSVAIGYNVIRRVSDLVGPDAGQDRAADKFYLNR